MSEVRVEWQDNADDEDSFDIERSINGIDFSVIGTAAALAGTGSRQSYTDDTVAPGATYWYRVRARNVAGTSAPSNTEQITIPGDETFNRLTWNGDNRTTWAADTRVVWE